MIGFYVLAIALAGALVYIPYAEWVYAHRIHYKVAIGCIGAAAVILWSIFPRIDRFAPPGPELRPDRHPGMFKAIREVAERTKQELPASVYVVPEINAWVAQRGGIMGLGSHRVMGIGLPLLQVTTVSQFKAILAHEFGHYYGGDTSLGPWIYKTRKAIGRTLENLGDDSWIRKPFIWYGNMFLRITHAISRQQEFSADQLAGRIYGPDTSIEALKAVYAHSSTFRNYWHSEVAPVLDAGHRPPIAEGFQAFVAARPTATAVSASLEEEMKERPDDPFDTHPGLLNRIKALSSLPKRKPPEKEPSAISLIHDLPALETEMLAFITGEQEMQALKAIQWRTVGSDIYLPLWEQAVGKNSGAFQGMTANMIAEAATDLPSFVRKLDAGGEQVSDDDEREQRTIGLLGAALSLALQRQGWQVNALPGEEVTLELKGVSVQPFVVVRRLAEGTMRAEEWQQQSAEAGIAETPLG